MRCAKLELLRFGSFTDKVLNFDPTGLDFHLIYGPNEAGKTTTRAALSELLFGIDKSTRFAFLHDPASLRIGATLSEGQESLRFIRKKGLKSNLKNTLLDPNEQPLVDTVLTPFLGGADRAFFERMFSLDHAALVAGVSELVDSKDDVGRMLFQASSGLNRLGDLRKSLEDQADRLWGPRRSRDRAYYTAFEQYQSSGVALESQTVRVRDYLKAEEDVSAWQIKAEKLASEHEELERTRLKLERIRRVAPGLTRRQALLEDLKEFAAAPFLPEDADKSLVLARSQIRASREELTRLSSQRSSVAEEVLSPGPDSVLLGLAEPIHELRARAQELRRFPEDLNKRRAEVATHLAQATELAQALGWSSLDEANLRAILPSALELASFEQLLLERDRVALADANASSSLAKRKEELSELVRQLESHPGEGAPVVLRVAVEQCLRLGDVETRRSELEGPAELSREHLRHAFGQLLPWKGNLAALRALSLPSEAELEGISRQFERNAAERELLLSEKRKNAKKRESLRLQESQVLRDTTPVTREELQQARSERATLWHPLRQALGPQGTQPAESEVVAFEAAVTRTDKLADGRFESAAASATLQQVIAELEQLDLAGAQGEAQLLELTQSQDQLVLALSALVPEAGLGFDTPARLRRWLKQAEEARVLGNAAEQSRQQLQQYERDVANLEQQLRQALADSGMLENAPSGAGFSALLRHGKQTIKELDEGRARQLALRERQEVLERALVDLRAHAESAASALGEWSKLYVRSLEKLRLDPSLSPASAKRALQLLLELTTKLSKATTIRKERIDTMTRDLEQFSADVQRLLPRAGACAVDLSSLDPFEQTRLLEERLTEQERSLQNRLHAKQTLEQIDDAIAQAERRLAQAEASLAPLYELGGTRSIAELAQRIEQSNRRRELTRALEQQQSHLLESGDGLSLEELQREACAVDLAQLEATLEETRDHLEQLAAARKKADLALAEAKHAFAAMAGREEAAAQATRRAESLSAMTQAIDQYVYLRTASHVLRWAVERFRKDLQGPLLSRAGKLFASLTSGAFEGLAVDYDDDEKPELFARRGGGGSLGVLALSSGTRDQLYLSLRLAALELHLDGAQALPFVADDLCVHFDDTRTMATFRVLGELAERTQVLFFTHHEHLIDLATRALGGRGHIHRLA